MKKQKEQSPTTEKFTPKTLMKTATIAEIRVEKGNFVM